MVQEKEYLEETLYDFFFSILSSIEKENLPLIYEGENGVRPVPPFLSLDFNGISVLGTTPYFTQVFEEDETFIQASKQTVERQVTLRGFGSSCEDVLSSIRGLLEFEEFINELKLKGLVITQVQDIIENDATYSEDSETFYSMDFVVTYERIIKNETTYIEHTEIDSKSIYNTDGQETDNSINVEI